MTSYIFNQTIDSDDEDEVRKYLPGKDASIAIIDCNPSMFEPIERTGEEDDDEEENNFTNLFEKCLNVIEKLMLERIIHDYNDLFGVILYNTKNSPKPTGVVEMDYEIAVPEKCAVLIPVKECGTDVIRYVKNMLASEDLMDFNNKFGSSEGANISEVLFLCSTMFTLSSKKIRTREIFWFTNQDSPHQAGQPEHHRSFQKAKDLQQLNFHVAFFPMSPEFDGNLFWREFIAQLMDLDAEAVELPNYTDNYNSLVNSIYRRGYKKRAIAYLEFEVTEKSKFGVGIYSNKRSTPSYPKCTKLSRVNNEEIITKRVTKFADIPDQLANDDQDVDLELSFSQKLDPSRTVKYQEVAGEKICFTTLEAFEIKQVMDPKIKLIGFKPLSTIDECNYYIKTQMALYPHDGQIKNSSVFFRALWERLLIDQLVAICIMTTRLKSYPRLVALIPTKPVKQDDEEMRFEGFRILPLPFSDEIRDLDEIYSDPPEEDNEETTFFQSKFSKLIKKMRVPFDPTVLENPICGRLYTRIEAQTYDEEVNLETLENMKMPNVERQDERISQLVDEFEEFIGGFEEDFLKRKAEKENAKEKRQKTCDINMEKILEDCKSGNVKNITVDMLRSYLSLKSVSGTSKMKKSDLIDKIIELN